MVAHNPIQSAICGQEAFDEIVGVNAKPHLRYNIESTSNTNMKNTLNLIKI